MSFLILLTSFEPPHHIPSGRSQINAFLKHVFEEKALFSIRKSLVLHQKKPKSLQKFQNILMIVQKFL